MPIPAPLRSIVPACAAFALLSAATCHQAPPPEEVSIPFDNYRVDVPAGGAVANLDRTVTVYAGKRATDFTLDLTVSNLPAGARVEVQSGIGAVLQTLTTNGRVRTVPFGGNVGRIRVRVPNVAQQAPNVVIHTINTTRVERFVQPVLVAAPANTVSAFPLTLGDPVDFALHDQRDDSFHFSVGGLVGREFDVILIGSASLWIAEPGQGFPLSSGDGMEAFTPQRAGLPTLSLPGAVISRFPAGDRDSLRITVSNVGVQRMEGVRDAFHARLLVVPAGAVQPLAFPSSRPDQFFPWPVGVDQDGSASPPSLQTALNCTNYAGRSGTMVISGPVPGFAAPPAVTVPGPPVCYDGHGGSDFSSPAAGSTNVPVTAAASGIVVETLTGNVDTCFANPAAGFAITCPGTTATTANFVTVRQDDGRFARYYHLRNQPLPVAPGDRIVCGQLLGNAGSSGNSSGPHLHFELRSLAASAADPFLVGIDRRVGQTGTVVDPYPDGWRRKLPGNVPLPACS
ncbi:MAG TPA: M23 family metallopeptidase [Longimicrobium sp.]|nr:M23 family metallopeptidase [Longimicrobium sp.]